MNVFVDDPDFTLHVGDALETLRTLPDGSVDCCVTSPPYWGLRDYNTNRQLGLEATPDEYVTNMVGVFREVRRVLADHGTCWLNIGDSHHAKQLQGIPWRVAFALQADAWYLRSDIVWSKPNPMPESVTDRPTKAHEYVFLLSKGPRYFFDQEAVREPHSFTSWSASGDLAGMPRKGRHETPPKGGRNGDRQDAGTMQGASYHPAGRNVRSVWEIATRPFSEAHFATYPPELVRRCLLAGCPERVCRTCGKPAERIVEGERIDKDGSVVTGAFATDAGKSASPGPRPVRITATVGWSDCGHNNYRPGVVLDPFLGSGTTALVAREHGRRCVGVELNPEYAAMAARRLGQLSLLAEA